MQHLPERMAPLERGKYVAHHTGNMTGSRMEVWGDKEVHREWSVLVGEYCFSAKCDGLKSLEHRHPFVHVSPAVRDTMYSEGIQHISIACHDFQPPPQIL